MISYKMNDGEIDYTQTQDSLSSCIYFSLEIRRGTWFFNPSFGCRWKTIKKLDNDGIARAEDYAKEALKWLLDLEQLSNIDIICERDDRNFNRCNVKITAFKNDTVEVYFETFFMVV